MKPIAYMLDDSRMDNKCVCVKCAPPFIERFPLHVYAVFMRQTVRNCYCTVCLADIVPECEIKSVAI